jgi:hypothetical protein
MDRFSLCKKKLGMASQMHAAVVEQFEKPLLFGSGQPVARGGSDPAQTKARGVRHTDLPVADVDWPVKPPWLTFAAVGKVKGDI